MNILIFPEIAFKFVHTFCISDVNTTTYKSLPFESSGLKMIIILMGHADILFMHTTVSTNIMIFCSFTQVLLVWKSYNNPRHERFYQYLNQLY